MLSLLKPDKERMDLWLDEQRSRNLNYVEAGWTRDERLPRGYNIDRNSILLGHGEEVYRRAVAAIVEFRMWDFDWIEMCWPTTPIEVGSILATLTWQWGFWYLNACRILYV